MDICAIRSLVESLEAEVNNGGFDQFFFNSAGDNAKASVKALEAIGAHRMAAIVSRAMQLFPGGFVPTDRDERQKLLESVSPDGDAFEAFDVEFLSYPENLSALLESAGCA